MTGSANTDFSSMIELQDGSLTDRFTGPVSPERDGKTYGGQLLAQAVAAAYRTVDEDRQIHSLHAVFLRAGDVNLTTDWQVDRVRDGRSFSTRVVSGYQTDREIFRVTTSFHVPEDGLSYQADPDIDVAGLPSPDEVAMTYVDFCRAHPDLDQNSWFGQDRPMEILYINPPDPAGGPPVDEPQLMWLRISGELADEPGVASAALAYLADSTLIDHVTLPHGHRWHDARVTGVSLDHSMWFHRPFRPDQWLLYDQRVESTGGARGLASARFYTRAGELVASCAQEGLMRWSE